VSTEKKKRKLLFSVTKKDFIIQAYKSSGPGGQHRNKTMSAIRMVHPESGAMACSGNERSQHQNKRLAFKALVARPEFQKWIRVKAAAAGCDLHELERAIEKQVTNMMAEENLKVEIRGEDGKWETAKEPLQE